MLSSSQVELDTGFFQNPARDVPMLESWNKRGLTALHIASVRSKLDVVDVLLNNKADVSSESWMGSTPLVYVCQNANDDQQHAEIIKHLVDKGGVDLCIIVGRAL